MVLARLRAAAEGRGPGVRQSHERATTHALPSTSRDATGWGVSDRHRPRKAWKSVPHAVRQLDAHCPMHVAERAAGVRAMRFRIT